MRLIAQSVASAGQPAGWGGRQEGVAGRDPSQGSPVPSSTPTPTPQENPQPGTPTRPQSPPVLGPATPHIPCAPSQGVHLCLGALTSLHSSVHLPRSICLSLCVCLSFSGCVACFSRVLSFHECLPISVSTCISCISLSTCLLSACSLGFLFFASPSFPFFRSICHPSVPLSFCPRASSLEKVSLHRSGLYSGYMCQVVLVGQKEESGCLRLRTWPTEPKWLQVGRPGVCNNALMISFTPFGAEMGSGDVSQNTLQGPCRSARVPGWNAHPAHGSKGDINSGSPGPL